jgi:dCMP deaminase
MNYSAAMSLALSAASHSPDPSTQNGAVILGHPETADCNRFPVGVAYRDERWERPLKYRFIEHAERNAIYAAARNGVKTNGGTLVCPWAACSDCARAIVMAGIKTLVRFPMQNDATGNHWHDECAIGDTIMREGGVEIIEEEFRSAQIPNLLRNGKKWDPWSEDAYL